VGDQVHVSCFQVAGKDVFDLLTAGDKLVVREDGRGVVQASLPPSACTRGSPPQIYNAEIREVVTGYRV